MKHGTAAAPLRALNTAIKAVQPAGNADDFLAPAGRADLSWEGGRAAVRIPLPHCAEPAGDYAGLLAHIQAAGDNPNSASGLRGLILAAVPLRAVPGIDKMLNAELGRTVGTHR